MATADLKRTPLHDWHAAHDARLVAFGGWEMPLHYAPGILQEHLGTRRGAGLFDVCHMGRFRVGGRDDVAFLQHVLSNNVESLQRGRAQYTLIPDASGGVIDDAYLYRPFDDRWLLVVNAANRAGDWEHLCALADRFADVSLQDETEALAMVALQGPRAGAVLQRLVEAGALPDPFRNAMSEADLCGTRALVARTGYTGEPIGFELFVPADDVTELWSRVCAAGADDGVLPVGLGARDTLRLEAGLPLYGHELGADPGGRPMPALALPLAAMAVSFTPRKGDFVGRAALQAQFAQLQELRRGTAAPSRVLDRMIRPLAILESGVARHGHAIFNGDRQVGLVTSGTVAPFWRFAGAGVTARMSDGHDRRCVALACLDADVGPQAEVVVQVRQRRLRARVVDWHGRSDAPPWFRPTPADDEPPSPPSGRPAMTGAAMARAENLLEKALANHAWRQQRCVNLIPSEMTPSPLVRMLQVSDPVGRYAEHRALPAAFNDEVFYYQGTDFIAWVEEQLAAEMAAFLGCPLIEARPVSGQMANMAVFSALVDHANRLDRRREPGRLHCVANNHLAGGGHLSAQPLGALRDYVAKDPITERYAVLNFPALRDDPYRIDVAQTARLLEQVRPALLILGKSMVLYPEPVAEIRALLGPAGPLGDGPERPVLMVDMAHVLGLVGPHFQQPFEDGADLVTASTHKTFFGTQRGVIGADLDEHTPGWELWQAIRRRTFPGMVSNHHLGSLLGLLLAAMEMNAFKSSYQPQVLANARALARALHDAGLSVEGDPAGGFTQTHQVLVNVGHARACAIARTLEERNIIVNYQALPGDESFTASSGLRLGVAEMTRFGMRERDFETFAPLFADALRGDEHVGDKVAEFRKSFQTMHYCFDDAALEPLRQRLAATF